MRNRTKFSALVDIMLARAAAPIDAPVSDPTEKVLGVGLEARSIDEAAREVDFVASTENIDGHGTIIRQNFRFDRYDANPVVLWSHGRDFAVPNLPIGQSVSHRVEGGKLMIKVRFATAKANPLAELCFQSVVERCLRGGSVRVRPGKVTYERHNDREVEVYDENELIEFSLCPIPSNAETLAIARRLGISDEDIARSMGPEQGEDLTRGNAPPGARGKSPPGGSGDAPGKKQECMKKLILTRAHVDELRAKGFTTVQVGDEVNIVESPDVARILADAEGAVAASKTAVERATAAESKLAAAEAATVAANKRADEAVERAADLELAKLILPAAKRVALRALAVTAPEQFRALIDIEGGESVSATGLPDVARSEPIVGPAARGPVGAAGRPEPVGAGLAALGKAVAKK